MDSTRAPSTFPLSVRVDWAWLFAFSEFTILIASVVLKTAGIGLFILIIAAYSFHSRRRLLAALAPTWPFMLLPALALFSTLWSVNPSATLRASVQYAITFYFAILVARLAPSGKLVTALFYSLLLICVLSLADAPHALSYHRALNGIFESKNSMAFVASALMIVAFGLLIDPARSFMLRAICLGCIPLALAQLVLAQSAGAVVSTAIATLILLATAMLSRCPPGLRLAALLLVVACVPGLVVARPIMEQAWTNFATEKLHKDIVTMTGRTTMWARADEIAHAKPLLGEGYQAFWIQGSLDAEALWEELDIASRSGFNFHNQFKELRVDLGWAGVIVFYGVLGAGLIGLAVRPFITPSHTLNIMFGLLVSLALKTPVESLLFYQFSLLSVLFITFSSVGLAGEVGRATAGRATTRSQAGFRRAAALSRYAKPRATASAGAATLRVD